MFLTDEYFTAWDEYVKQSPGGTFYHLIAWKKIIEKTFGFNPLYLIVLSEEGKISGGLPLFVMKDIFGRRYLISNPSLEYAGICGDTEHVKIELLKQAEEIAIEHKVQYLELRQADIPMHDLPAIKDFVTMTLAIGIGEENVWKNSLNTKARNQVRKAYKEGLTVDIGNKYFDDFYRVFSINMRDLGTPVYPKIFLKNILDEFGNSSGIMVVKYRNIIIAGMLFVFYKNIFFNLFATSLKTYNTLCPNDILYWEAIKYACRNGLEHFDFGRSTIGSGTFNFKKKWGALQRQLYYQYFLNRSDKMPEVSAHNNQYQMAINLWKKLPLPIAETLGPRLVRYLPEY